MTKSEFIGRLEAEANDEKHAQIYSAMVEAVREVLDKYSDGVQIETEKGIKDLYSAMEGYARAHKEGSCGYCPPSEVQRLVKEVFGLDTSTAAASAADIDVFDLF